MSDKEIKELREEINRLRAALARLNGIPGVQVLPNLVQLGQSSKVSGDLEVTGSATVAGNITVTGTVAGGTIDADTLDGIDSAGFATAGHTHTSLGSITVSGDLTLTGDLIKGSISNGAVWHYLTTPLTSTSWDGDAFSTTGKTLIDLSAVFSAPASIKAVLLYVAVRDSGSQASETFLILGPTNSNLVGMGHQPDYVNDRYSRATMIVPCDGNGDIYYQIQASGAGTFDVFMQIWGYAK